MVIYKKQIGITLLALALSLGGAFVLFYVVPRVKEIKKPYNPEVKDKIKDAELE
jgi:F0F1-type ATP synthase membrane subunit b/b'